MTQISVYIFILPNVCQSKPYNEFHVTHVHASHDTECDKVFFDDKAHALCDTECDKVFFDDEVEPEAELDVDLIFAFENTLRTTRSPQ